MFWAIDPILSSWISQRIENKNLHSSKQESGRAKKARETRFPSWLAIFTPLQNSVEPKNTLHISNCATTTRETLNRQCGGSQNEGLFVPTRHTEYEATSISWIKEKKRTLCKTHERFTASQLECGPTFRPKKFPNGRQDARCNQNWKIEYGYEDTRKSSLLGRSVRGDY